MKKTTLDECNAEAHRFIKRVKDLKNANEMLEREDPENRRFSHFSLDLAKYTAAVRRSSLDLTKSLAALRQER